VVAVVGCGKDNGRAEPRNGGASVPGAGAANPFASFRDVPGVTAAEIAGIEALQREREHFTYGRVESIEAFLQENGEYGGFSTLVCEWLTGLFAIPFKPVENNFSDLIAGLEGHTVDFMGNVTATEERRLKNYFMTDPIAERQLKMMRLRGSSAIEHIARERLPRFAFLRNSNNGNMAMASMTPGSFESVIVNNTAEAHEALQNGTADAFVETNNMVDIYSAEDVYSELFFPLIFDPVSLTTANPALEPVISVVNKALRGGAIHHINYLFNLGYAAYKKERFLSRLSAEEKEYLANTVSVPLATRYFNYPIDFFNAYERKWEGIIFDVLDEVEKLTGLKFEVVNDERTEFPDLLEMLYDGRAHILPDVTYSARREGQLLWAKNNFLPNQYALLSRGSYPNISLNEISYARVGLITSTASAGLFRTWFPGASNIREYDNDESAFRALDQGEVDMVMASKNRLLSIVNYYEFSDFKAVYLFTYTYSSFVFNKNEAVLCNIVDKALQQIDTSAIVEPWMSKTYDYRARLIEAQRPWLIGAVALSLAVLALMVVMFLRGRGEGKRLAKVVAVETSTLTAILDATPDHLFCKDLDRHFTRCNKNMADYHRFRMENIIGKTDVEAFNLPPERAEQLKVIEQKVFEEKHMHVCEETVMTPYGTMHLYETIRAPLVVNGKVTGLVGMARDITRRKAAEETAKKASADAMKAFAEAEAASEAKSRFIANMSHEMRTPMNVIVGLTDLMLEEDSVSGKVKEELKKINTAGNTLTGIINDILDISKIEAGRQDLNPVQYDVASFLNDIITLNIVRIGEKAITFNLDIDDSLPQTLLGDDLRVKQVLNNLLSNAFKYTESGTVTLQIRNEKLGMGNEEVPGTVLVTFSVIDTGIGIREEDVKKLFSDYNQVDTKANRKIEGTGLGLSITKKFVEMMGGEITVESEYGKGTTFRASIRQGFVTDTPIPKEIVEKLRSFRYQDEKKQAQGKIVRADLSYARVLVVDDFPMNLDVAAGMLRKYKMQVDCVQSGQEAIDRIQAGGPVYNAVFMDHMMPGMDGVEATKLIRALGTEYAENIPVIALTANAVAGSEKMFLENGFNAFLPKPFNAPLLDSVVKQWIRQNKSEE
jgi:PAS domain S-box-containing protein